jgi:hypothetical protein
LKIAQNPTRRLHALLGAVELEDSLTEKDTIANRLKFLHTTYFLATVFRQAQQPTKDMTYKNAKYQKP